MQLADNAAAVDAARRGQAVVDSLNARVDALAEENARLTAELSGARAAARTEMLSLQQLADERARVAAGLQSDLEAALAALGSGSGGGRGGDHGYGHDQGRAQQHSLLAGARGGSAAAAGGGADDSAQQSTAAAAPEAAARSQARRRRILMGGDGTSSGTTAGKPVLPPALPGGSGPGRPGPPPASAAPAVSGSVVQLQLQAESLARRLTQEQATVAALQAEQREVLAVNERLRRALLDAGLGSSSHQAATAAALDDDEGASSATPPPLHVLARAFWLRLRQGERTCGAVRRLVTAVHATLVTAHELLAGAGGGAALEAAQRLLDGYAQAGRGGADGGAPLFRCVVLPHTDTHGALGAGACSPAAAAAACPLSFPHPPSPSLLHLHPSRRVCGTRCRVRGPGPRASGLSLRLDRPAAPRSRPRRPGGRHDQAPAGGSSSCCRTNGGAARGARHGRARRPR